MENKKDMQSIVYSLIGKEVDTEILLALFSNYNNNDKEVISKLLKFSVIQSTTSSGSIYKGIVKLGQESLTIDLDYSYNGVRPTYVMKKVC